MTLPNQQAQMAFQLLCWRTQMQPSHPQSHCSLIVPLDVAALHPSGKCPLLSLYQKNPGAKQPGDFRPISLLPIISKVLENHFLFWIANHLTTNHPLSNYQWGFQPGKSTVSALIECTHDWFLHLDKHREIGAVFFDFKKAFDTVPHQPLLYKLLWLNLDSCITTWIHNYLADRYQRVVINGECSLASQVLSGVPQGSIFGPLLF